MKKESRKRLWGIALVVIGVILLFSGNAIQTILGVIGESFRGVLTMIVLFVVGFLLIVWGLHRLFSKLDSKRIDRN